MTYPPQPPYQPQPPFQQQPYGGGPGYGPGYGPYGPPPGGMPPSRPSKAPLVVGGVVVVVALVVIFVGGFAWPGWFTSDKPTSTANTLNPTTAAQEAQRFVTAINQQDGATLNGFACTQAQSSVADYVNKVLRYQVHASLKGSPTMDQGNTGFEATARITVGGQTTDYTSYWLSQNNVSFCMMSIVEGVTESSGGSGG